MKSVFRLSPIALAITVAMSLSLSACGGGDDSSSSAPPAVSDANLESSIQDVVVIYAENRGFDNLYGLYKGADGIPGVNPTAVGSYIPQTDRDAANTVLAKLPKVWGGVSAAGQTVQIPEGNTAAQDNKPFQIDADAGFQATGIKVGQDVITRDLYHRFFENQMQINGGKNDKFAAYADSGGLTMGYYDGSKMALWKLAQQYTLADNFFMGAFGGSFLNHQYLVCACAPEYPNADADSSPAKATISALEKDAKGNVLPVLTQSDKSLTSATLGAPVFVNSNNLTPRNYAGDGKIYAINTMQPPFQPSSNAPAAGADAHLADLTKANTLPPQAQTTIADELDKKNVSWAWYAGGWNTTLTSALGDRKFAVPSPNFQFHHQPFNYYTKFDPTNPTTNAYRTAHLKDFDSQFLADAAAGKLPAVAFYKPQGNLNQHSGYANVKDGDDHIASVIAQLQKSPQWKHMLIVVTYDENGGFWDHKQVPKGDVWGPSTRVPAIIISPYAKAGAIDHTQYDTASILRFVTRRWKLDTLPGLKQRDDALVKNGAPAMGDLTNALDPALVSKAAM